MDEPLNHHDARTLLRSILEADDGTVDFSGHALKRMETRKLTEMQVLSVLRNGYIPAHNYCDFINGSWRYKVHGRTMKVVVAFVSETRTLVITAIPKDQ